MVGTDSLKRLFGAVLARPSCLLLAIAWVRVSGLDPSRLLRPLPAASVATLTPSGPWRDEAGSNLCEVSVLEGVDFKWDGEVEVDVVADVDADDLASADIRSAIACAAGPGARFEKVRVEEGDEDGGDGREEGTALRNEGDSAPFEVFECERGLLVLCLMMFLSLPGDEDATDSAAELSCSSVS